MNNIVGLDHGFNIKLKYRYLAYRRLVRYLELDSDHLVCDNLAHVDLDEPVLALALSQ